MNYIKVIFGGICFFLLVYSALSGIWDFVGNFIQDIELKGLVTTFTLLFLGWGYNRFETEWRHYK
jgi:hypothetical protein